MNPDDYETFARMTADQREQLAAQEQAATDRAAALLAPLEAEVRELNARKRAEHRAAVLREAAEMADRIAVSMGAADEDWASRARWACASVAAELRRMAAETRSADTQDIETRRPLVRWHVERRDHDGWFPASHPTRDHQRAAQDLDERRAEHPDRDFRLTRGTTTYTVEETGRG